jgi:hypothetical protein
MPSEAIWLHFVVVFLFSISQMKEFSIESLLFWLEIENWKSFFSDNPADEDSARARATRAYRAAWRIVQTFMSATAPLEVNVPDGQLRIITDTLNECKDNDSAPPVTLFDTSQNEIFKLMERDSFQRWKNEVRRSSMPWKAGRPRAVAIPGQAATVELPPVEVDDNGTLRAAGGHRDTRVSIVGGDLELMVEPEAGPAKRGSASSNGSVYRDW